MEGKRVAEYAYDLQTGLARYDITELPALKEIGMAASLAVHIKGLAEIDFDVLRQVSDYYFDIPSYALKNILELLEEIQLVQLITLGRTIKTVIPSIPHFDNLYDVLGKAATDTSHLNEHEQAILVVLDRLSQSPENKDSLLASTGIDRLVYDRCLEVGEVGGIISQRRARARSILVSPLYFADGLDSLADLAARAGSTEIRQVLDIVKHHQGWPLSLLTAGGKIGGYQLNAEQIMLVKQLASEGVLKPPTINFSGRAEPFIFTPRPGAGRLNASNREIYERAMALVAAVRKGQFLADQFRIKMPVRLLMSLRDKGYLNPNSEAAVQYQNLVAMRVAFVVNSGGGQYRLQLNRTEENIRALDLAISLLRTGDITDMEINQDARIALTKDEKYIQSIVASAELKKREKLKVSESVRNEFDQLLLQFC